jgi:hypothetical protein
MRALFFSFLISAGFALIGPGANAAPASGAALGATAAQSPSLTLVADGCGPGRYYSHFRGFCIWNSPPYRAYGYYRYYVPLGVYAPPAYYGYSTGDVYYGPPPADYYIDPNGYYASTVIYNTPRGRYFDLWYY